MANNFSFGATANAAQSTFKPRLVGNDIYTVQFDGCVTEDIKGVKDPTQVYKVLKLKFSNQEGAFEHTVFEPKSEDFERKSNEFTNKNGKTESIPQPSNVESMMLLFKHAIDTINPTIAKQIDSNEKNLGAASWDDLRGLVAKILDAGKGVTTKIKLLKNNKGEAQFPGFFTGISKEGKVYVKNNFIGERLSFSTYEADKINKEQNAKPTSAASFNDTSFNTSAPADLDMDFTITDL
jgi:hypothetical protein